MTKFHITISFEGEHPHEVFSLFHGLEALSKIDERLGCIEASIERILNTMATQAELDAGIVDLKTVAADAGNKISKSLDDLVAKLNTGTTTVDFTSELADIRAVASGLASLGQKAAGDDPGTAPPPVVTPPATP